MPKLEDWQIKDYIRVNCKGLDQYSIDWLYSAAKGNICRIATEIDKIKIFNINEQKEILSEIRYEPTTDLYSQNLFDFAEAVVKKDVLTITDYFLHKDACNFDTFALIGLLLKTFKKILFVNFKSGLTAEQLGLTTKQYSAVQYYYKALSKDYIENSVKFLTKIDERIKTGKLDIQKDNLIDYIVCNIVSFNKR